MTRFLSTKSHCMLIKQGIECDFAVCIVSRLSGILSYNRTIKNCGFIMTSLEIIERIGYFRTKAKLSQKALSIDIGMNIGYINRLESKKDFLPSMEVLLKIIEACGITPEEFFYSNINSYSTDKQLLDKLRDLSDDKKEALIKLIK